jgi:hypothetical protein
MDNIKKGLELLREPFPKHQIGSLPKPTKEQTEIVKKDYKQGIRCDICKGWHHPKVVHLDYVGHAALTDRLLDADPLWSWEPVAYNEKGLPAFDETGGLWIKLIVCGHTRLGYGHAEKSNFKEIGSREKEVIGDAIRNAAMRFGAALDLWHKGDLHGTDDDETPPPVDHTKAPKTTVPKLPSISPKELIDGIDKIEHQSHCNNWYLKHHKDVASMSAPEAKWVAGHYLARIETKGLKDERESLKRKMAAEEAATKIAEAKEVFK